VLTIILPTVITSLLTLLTFWVEDYPLAVCLNMLNILLQGIYGWAMIKELPPGSGATPKIVYLYVLNLCVSAGALIVHVLFHFLSQILSEDIELPYKLTDITDKLRSVRFFQVEGLSFDPQMLFTETFNTDLVGGTHPNHNTAGADAAGENPANVTEETLQMDAVESDKRKKEQEREENDGPTSSNFLVDFGEGNGAQSREDDQSSLTNLTTSEVPSEKVESVVNPKKKQRSHLEDELYVFRRAIFFFFLLFFIVMVPLCIT
jgi:hypothetical protein